MTDLELFFENVYQASQKLEEARSCHLWYVGRCNGDGSSKWHIAPQMNFKSVEEAKLKVKSLSIKYPNSKFKIFSENDPIVLEQVKDTPISA